MVFYKLKSISFAFNCATPRHPPTPKCHLKLGAFIKQFSHNGAEQRAPKYLSRIRVLNFNWKFKNFNLNLMQFCDNGGAAGPEISIQNITVSILPQRQINPIQLIWTLQELRILLHVMCYFRFYFNREGFKNGSHGTISFSLSTFLLIFSIKFLTSLPPLRGGTTPLFL